jgi:diguanylate cyclase (GGDEF)-like protein
MPTALPAPTRADFFVSPALAALERERYASYSVLVRNLHWLAASLVMLYAVLDGSRESAVLYALASAMVVYTLLVHSTELGARLGNRSAWLEAVVDLAWVTAVVLATGGAGSPLFFLYYMGLFATLPAAGRGPTYAKAAAVTLVALALALRGGDAWSGGWAAAVELVWPLAALWLVAYFAAESGSVGTTVHRSLLFAAHTDALTGLPNLRHFTATADLRGQLGQPYTIVMIDADHLKRVNDTWGHAKGNELIQRVADALRTAARSGDDLCSRIGGDEYIVRLAGASSEGALSYCRRVRRHLAAHPLLVDGERQVAITISIGIAAYPAHGRNLSEITEHADQALYESKRAGRDRVHMWTAAGIREARAEPPLAVANVAVGAGATLA